MRKGPGHSSERQATTRALRYDTYDEGFSGGHVLGAPTRSHAQSTTRDAASRIQTDTHLASFPIPTIPK